MKNYLSYSKFTIALVSLMILGEGNQMAVAQTFENTAGYGQHIETAWDSKPLFAANSFAVISNTSQKNARMPQLQFSRFGINGAFQGSKVYAANKRMSKVLEGRAIEKGMITKSKKVIYMAGAKTYSNQAVILMTNEEGTPILAFQQSSAGANTSMATSLEVISGRLKPDEISPWEKNNYVIVAGEVTGVFSENKSTSQFFVSRFNNDPDLVPDWSFRYCDPSSVNGNYQIGKTCVGELTNGLKVLAVTGSYTHNDNRQLFVSCIDLRNGTELWRQVINAELPGVSEGADIIQDPLTKNFMAVGYHQQARKQKSMFVVIYDQNGGFLVSVRYELASQNSGSEIVARDVTYNIDNNAAVIAGYLRSPEQDNIQKTFALELPVTPGALPRWSKYYRRSLPDIKATESIERNEGKGDEAGYFITTQAFHEGIFGKNDIHLINTNSTGENLMSSSICAVIPFQLNPVKCDNSAPLQMTQHLINWETTKVYQQKVKYPVEFCK